MRNKWRKGASLVEIIGVMLIIAFLTALTLGGIAGLIRMARDSGSN